MKKLFITLIALFITALSFAQDNYRIYKKNNYIWAVNQTTSVLLEEGARYIKVDKPKITSVDYDITGLGSLPRLNISQILKEDGSPYTVTEWEEFYTSSTQNFSTASGGSGAVTSVNGLTGDVVIDNSKFEGIVNNETEYNALTPVEGSTMRVATEFLIGGLITVGVGDWYYDGSSWQITTLDVVDIVTYGGTVDADAELLNFRVGQALHFHTIASTTFTSGQLMGSIVNENALAGFVNVTVEAGVQGVLRKNADGSVVVFYTTKTEDIDWALSTQGLTTECLPTVTNAPRLDYANTFTVDADGYYFLKHKADAVNGTGILYIGTTVGTQDIFDNLTNRITATELEKSYTIELEAGVTYHVSTQAGGGSDMTNACYELYPVSYLSKVTLSQNALDNGYSLIGQELDAPKPDVNAYNEYINNLDPYYVVFSKENFARTISNVNVNGVNATFDTNANAIDNGDGSLTLNTTGNGSFSARANTNETIIGCDEYFEITSPAGGNFTTIEFSLTTDPEALAEQNGNTFRVQLGGTNWNVLDTDGNVLGNGTGGTATYRFTRTLAGFKIERDGVEIYNTSAPSVPTDYRIDPQPVVPNASGYYRVEDRHAVQTSIANDNTTNIVTGHDLTQAGDLTLKFSFADDTGAHLWQNVNIDASEVLNRFNATAAQDGSMTIFSDDYIRINVVDPATGEFQFIDTGREFEYLWSELWVVADQSITDTTSSGYQDIQGTNLRFQWGTSTTGVVILPVPFADNSYKLTATAQFNDARIATTNSKTTTQFNILVETATGGSSGVGADWMAIGIKPQ